MMMNDECHGMSHYHHVYRRGHPWSIWSIRFASGGGTSQLQKKCDLVQPELGHRDDLVGFSMARRPEERYRLGVKLRVLRCWGSLLKILKTATRSFLPDIHFAIEQRSHLEELRMELRIMEEVGMCFTCKGQPWTTIEA